MNKFKAKIEIIGINPFVFIPLKILKLVFKESGKEKGKIPVTIKIDGHQFLQTLIKYSGHWRLYLNTPMRKAAGKDVGDVAEFEIRHDNEPRTISMQPDFKRALERNKEAEKVFQKLAPSKRHEIIRYIANLKTQESIDRNIIRAINFLLGKERFVGRDKP